LLDGLFGGGMKDPVRGMAQVVSCTAHRGHGIMQNCHMNLVVQADGVPATAVELNQLVHNQKWPSPGMTLPVTVDRANPQKVKIEWDELARSRDRSRQSAQDMAAAMRGEQPEGAGGPGGMLGGAQVVNLSGQDLADLPEEKKQKLRALGIPVPESPASAAAAPAGEDDAIDDRLDQLERLTKLKDAGALTEAEFEAQKKQILEG
jgi:hypothetical protein